MGTSLQVLRAQGILHSRFEDSRNTPLYSRSTRSRVSSRMMFRVSLLFPLIAAASAAPEARFSCEECVREMHGLAAMVKMGAIPIHDYIRDNYCPTLDSTAAQHFREDSLSKYYVGMLFGVVEHYFVDGALHVCQTAGTCSAREYTCDECIQGLEWVEMYLEDPIMIAEFRIYLEQNFCLSDWDDCKELVEEVPPFHRNPLISRMFRHFWTQIKKCFNFKHSHRNPLTSRMFKLFLQK